MGGSPVGVIQLAPSDLPYYLSIGWKPASEAEFNAQDERIIEEMEMVAQHDRFASGPQTIERLAYIDRLINSLKIYDSICSSVDNNVPEPSSSPVEELHSETPTAVAI